MGAGALVNLALGSAESREAIVHMGGEQAVLRGMDAHPHDKHVQVNMIYVCVYIYIYIYTYT
jgi:hypothetical protein